MLRGLVTACFEGNRKEDALEYCKQAATITQLTVPFWFAATCWNAGVYFYKVALPLLLA